jgi:hypothetical protein
MNKQFRALIILIVLFSSSFYVLLGTTPPAKATYVEGTIFQDTTWFLIESPFVLSGNVTVNPGVTLTIEPGVQARFGGSFSLNIDGKIVANGTNEKRILFTTNDPSHSIIWQTIRINGTQPSSFINCEVEYGTDGITVDDGYVELRSSSIRFTSQNGLLLNNGSILVEKSVFESNNAAGINIVNGSQAAITNNIFESNADGLTLDGHFTGDISITQNNIINNTNNGITLESNLYSDTIIDITQNNIINNTNNGITLESDTDSNTAITRNNVSANGNGFLVQTNTSTNIAHNYIYNNTVGILYQNGNNHQAHFNDLCNNTLGMDASSNVTVDATYNYWGHDTGPFHASLNPDGKGNPVGGDGTDLDFLFFLSMPSDYSNIKPTANLWTDKVLVSPNQNVMFIGFNSQDEGRVDQYLFDFGDGTNTGWITLSLFNHSYASPGNFTANLMVTDDFNTTSETLAIANITVQDNLTPLKTTLSLSSDTTVYNGNVPVTVTASNDDGTAVPDANVVFFSLNGGTFSPESGLTNSTGHFETTFTAPNVTELTNVMLIARAVNSESGYADGSDFKYLAVLPPLNVQIVSEPAAINSEGNSTVTVYVRDASGYPVPEADVSFFASNGTLSPITGTTDLNGAATSVFTAPLTLELINVTLSATASKTDYANGTSQNTITVHPKILALKLAAPPEPVFSGENSTITVQVTHNSEAISNATVTISSDIGGNFSAEEATTDSLGTSEFIFTAPQTTLSETVNATLIVEASKSGYASNLLSIVVPVKPKILSTQISLPSNTTFSDAKMNLTVTVKHETMPVQYATVTLTTQAGTFSAATGTTDINGNVTVEFTSPQVNGSTNITIIAHAAKAGYVDDQIETAVTVNPRTFSVLIIPPIINSGETTEVQVQVTCLEDGSRVTDAHVQFSLSNEDLPDGTTDAEGNCFFMLNSSQTSTQVVNMTAGVTKNGYVPGHRTISVTVLQPEGELPFLTIIMIMVPIVIVIVIVALIKLKIMVVSTEEETAA